MAKGMSAAFFTRSSAFEERVIARVDQRRRQAQSEPASKAKVPERACDDDSQPMNVAKTCVGDKSTRSRNKTERNRQSSPVTHGGNRERGGAKRSLALMYG